MPLDTQITVRQDAISKIAVADVAHYDTTKLDVVLRGHIRDAFTHSKLYDCIQALSQQYTLRIFIHTWTRVASNVSWRTIHADNTPVTDALIRDYFRDMASHIACILIDDDTQIQLHGTRDGFVGSSNLPMVGWKNMWYGMHRAVQACVENPVPRVLVVNFRFDSFTNPNKVTPADVLYNVDRCVRAPQFSRVMMFTGNEINMIGIDNQMIAEPQCMMTLVHHFHVSLDQINASYRNFENQEIMVYYENSRLFDASPIRPPPRSPPK